MNGRTRNTAGRLWQGLVALPRQIQAASRLLWRTLGLAWAADRPRTGAYLLLIVVSGAIPVATAWLSKLVLDAVNVALTQRGETILLQRAYLVAVWYVGLQFAGRLIATFQQPLQANLSTRVGGYAEQRLMRVGADIPDLDHFERKAFHDELALIQRLGGLQPMMLLGLLQTVGIASLAIIGSLALVWHFQPLLPAALLLGAVVLVRVQVQQEARVYRSMTERSEAARMMGYCAGMLTDAGAAKELLVYGLAPWFFRRWRGLAQETLQEEDRLRRAGLVGTLASVTLGAVLLAAGYAYVAAQLGNHRLTIGDFALYLSVVTGLQLNLFYLANNVGVCYGRLIWMRRVFTFLDETRPSITVAPAGQGTPSQPRYRQGIALRHLSFRYPDGAEPVLRDVTCTLRAGETVALVGENGAGKTTLVKLLTRLYDPTDGQILLDGVPLAQYDLADLRRRISVLFQDFAHFSLSARYNIGLGDVRQAEDRERVLTAARWSGADAVVAKLPRGLDTVLNRTFTGGVDLSGGEWQKIATARAAMRDAALVILDEPTAALDAQAEYELFQRFRELAAGRTVLLISHRFSTVRMADRILVLEDGRISEAGTHEELLALGGRYATLYEMQAGRYR